MASHDEADGGVKLSTLFDDVWNAYQFLEQSSEATNSENMQVIKQG